MLGALIVAVAVILLLSAIVFKMRQSLDAYGRAMEALMLRGEERRREQTRTGDRRSGAGFFYELTPCLAVEVRWFGAHRWSLDSRRFGRGWREEILDSRCGNMRSMENLLLSQRDFGLQPRVATKELPWVRRPNNLPTLKEI